MDSLNDTVWDVLISGTGLPQSLSALPTPFSTASITQHQTNEGSPVSRLSFSRAYSVSLSPHLIYARSNLVPALVSSKVYQQLEFLAVGSWWIYDGIAERQKGTLGEGANEATRDQDVPLRKIPGSREDVFADKTIDLRSTRSLMKVLKLAADSEAYSATVAESGDQAFPDFLTSQYKIDTRLQAPLQALTLSPDPPSKTSVSYAFLRLHRHLTSIGIFGPGFGAVVPKWGGLAEIAQVACRAGAVGGGVYVLKKGIDSIDRPNQVAVISTATREADNLLSSIKLQGGDEVKARWIVGTPFTLPKYPAESIKQQTTAIVIAHLTAIVSSSLTSLFPPPAEGSPPPASIVVVLPASSIEIPQSIELADVPAIHLIIHSSDTGECPEGQSIIYASTALQDPSASQLLSLAIETFLSAVPNEPRQPDVLWTLAYKQHHLIPSSPSRPSDPQTGPNDDPADEESNQHCGIIHLQDLGPSLALEDEVLKDVRAAWERITADDGDDRGAFMQFDNRVGIGGEEDDM
ncbi:MAG: hypothetical protein Q9172_006125 [Xanthocarpia lactea]